MLVEKAEVGERLGDLGDAVVQAVERIIAGEAGEDIVGERRLVDTVAVVPGRGQRADVKVDLVALGDQVAREHPRAETELRNVAALPWSGGRQLVATRRSHI